MKVLLVLIPLLVSVATTLGTDQVSELTNDTFDSYLTVSKLAIVDFYAPW